MKTMWCKLFHKRRWRWKTFGWGATYCYCTRCGRGWTINLNPIIKE